MMKSARVAAVTLISIAALVGWYSIAADYDYEALSGTYVFRSNSETSTLVLHPDHSFVQDTTQSGKSIHAVGEWHRIGEGDVTFSKEFSRLPGQQSYRDRFGPDPNGDEFADQEFGGDFQKFVGIYPSLHLDATPDALVLHKRFLH
jgi:hypothetical protein